MQCLVNTVDESELNNQAVVIVFAWSSKKQVVLHYPEGGLCVSCWLILDASLPVLLSGGLIGSSTCWICLVFQKELIIENSLPIPPYTQDHLLWMKTSLLGWLVLVHFAYPLFSSIPHYCTVFTFHCPSQFILKMEHCHYILVKTHMWKFSQGGFFVFVCLTYMEPKHQSD